jgi:type VI secretion system secreted protein Hcp
MRTLAVVAALLFLVVPAYADSPATITLTLDDIVDEQLSSFDWGIETSPLSTDTGAVAPPKFQELTITKTVDKSSSKLFQHCVRGTHFPEAVITCRKAGKGQQEFIIIKLTDIVITKDKVGSKGDAPTETLSLSYSKAQIQYPPQ